MIALVRRLTQPKMTPEERDIRMRGECIGIVSSLTQTKNIADTLRGAQMVYDWLKGGAAPTDTPPADSPTAGG
jgi:hypothetical protein